MRLELSLIRSRRRRRYGVVLLLLHLVGGSFGWIASPLHPCIEEAGSRRILIRGGAEDNDDEGLARLLTTTTSSTTSSSSNYISITSTIGARRRRGRSRIQRLSPLMGQRNSNSHKSKYREKHSSSSHSKSNNSNTKYSITSSLNLSSAFPPSDLSDEDDVTWLEDQGGERTKPPNWPSKVVFSQKLRWPGTSSAADIREMFRRRLLPGIRVKYIDDANHVLSGQYGVFATRNFNAFDVIGEYVGRVVDPNVHGEYVASIDWEDSRREKGVDNLWGVNSKDYGNEARMINHFHSIGLVPNVKLITAYIAELPHILVVVTRPIKKGEELLADYGPNYWISKYTTPPSDPLAPDFSPEAYVRPTQGVMKSHSTNSNQSNDEKSRKGKIDPVIEWQQQTEEEKEKEKEKEQEGGPCSFEQQ